MSSGGWKLSAAVAWAIFPGIAQADAMGAFMKCSYIAALSYADQVAEPASSVASAALSSCRPQMMSAITAQAAAVRKSGADIPKERIELMVSESARSSVHDFVIEMRGLAKQRGPNFYREAAERISRGQ